MINDPEDLATMDHVEYVREGGSEGIELVMWLVARGAMSDVAGGNAPSEVHRHYHVPASTPPLVSSFSKTTPEFQGQPVSPGQFAAVTLFSMLGATAQGAIGIGYGLVAGAGLVAIDPAFVPGPLLIIGVVIGCRHVIVEREHLDRDCWKRCMMGLPFGLFAGLAVLNAMSDRALGLSVGMLITFAAVALLSGVTVQRTPVVEVITGAASSFSAITASLPGPPLVVALSDLRPGPMRATTSSFMLVMTVISF